MGLPGLPKDVPEGRRNLERRRGRLPVATGGMTGRLRGPSTEERFRWLGGFSRGSQPSPVPDPLPCSRIYPEDSWRRLPKYTFAALQPRACFGPSPTLPRRRLGSSRRGGGAGPRLQPGCRAVHRGGAGATAKASAGSPSAWKPSARAQRQRAIPSARAPRDEGGIQFPCFQELQIFGHKRLEMRGRGRLVVLLWI